MKKYVLFAAVAVFTVACSNGAEKKEENHGHEHGEHADHDHGHDENKVEFGAVKVNPDQAIAVDAMIADFDAKGKAEVEYTVKGKITQVCSKMGCWVRVEQSAGEPFMVRFKDHFTIPTSTEAGTMAVMHGVAYRDTVSVEMLQHYAEDAGESPEAIAKITEPEVNFGFEADGIKILR